MVSMKSPHAAFRTLLPILTGLTLSGCDSDDARVLLPQPVPPTPPPIVGSPAELDLNNDGVIDYRFDYAYRGTDDEPMSFMTCYLYVRGVGSNEHQEGSRPLPDGALIDESTGWSRYTGWLADIDWRRNAGWDSTWAGPWAGVSKKNLALKLVGETVHYGWVRLSVTVDKGTLTVHDHAYQPVPEKPLLAGVEP